jgi:hypothetical protein
MRSFTTSAMFATAAASEAPAPGDKFFCPAKACYAKEGQECLSEPWGDKTKDLWKQELGTVNVVRAMHGLPPVVWSQGVYDRLVADWKDSDGVTIKHNHGNAYQYTGVEGPSGENIYYYKGGADPVTGFVYWYNEKYPQNNNFEDFKNEQGQMEQHGHFTAMMWHGLFEVDGQAAEKNGASAVGQGMACYNPPAEDNSMLVCRYKATDKLTDNTVNNKGTSTDHTQPIKKQLLPWQNTRISCEEAVAKVQQCEANIVPEGLCKQLLPEGQSNQPDLESVTAQQQSVYV